MNNVLLSIIIPVYNRAGEVDELLSSFAAQTEKNFEILIVDDGSTDNLSDVVQTYASTLQVHYFYQKNAGPGHARNRGMKEANGDWFLFIDSDCTVPSTYIQELNCSLREKNYDAFGGPDTYRDDFPIFLKAVNYAMTSFIGTGGTRGSTKKSVAKYYPRSFNMGIHRRVYEAIGGMNDLRHGQDMEFSNRIYRAGFTVKFLPQIPVFHKRRTNIKRFFKQIFNWGVARINLGRIDANMIKAVHFLPAVAICAYLFPLILLWIPFFRWMFVIETSFLVLILLFAVMQSTIQYRSVLVGLVSAPVLLIQVTAYGLGLLFGGLRSLFAKKGDSIKGFTKNYYR